MSTTSIAGLIILLLILAAVVFRVYYWPELRLRRILQQPFPDRWHRLLPRVLPVYPHLSPDLQRQLQQRIQQFIADKRFVGCAGQAIDDEVRMAIAAHACLLLLNRPTGCYPQLDAILVYPSTFVANREQADEAGLVSLHHMPMEGESWSHGKIVLAWDAVRRGVARADDGQNVVLHEFAHQLDDEDGVSNGAPLLHTRGAYQSWARVFAAEFATLQWQARQGWHSLLDHYGATNPAEFFAVATETFFERPHELQDHHGELYRELQAYYRVDPASWTLPPPQAGIQ
ncbi:MAG: hypothetical protein RLZZ385_517 [Pseudomonadota bacterium]|jgi:Mlc titration factor MtfA (ptsG expression regulator)